MFSCVVKNQKCVNVNENAVIDLIASVGIPRENINVEFDTYSTDWGEAGEMILYINYPVSDIELDAINKILTTISNDELVYTCSVKKNKLANNTIVNIKFNWEIYNENESAWN